MIEAEVVGCIVSMIAPRRQQIMEHWAGKREFRWTFGRAFKAKRPVLVDYGRCPPQTEGILRFLLLR
jgi:hypothetical protein